MDGAPDSIAVNLHDLERELAWLTQLLDRRFRSYFGGDAQLGSPDFAEPSPPDFAGSTSAWASFLREQPLSLVERLAVVLALVPHLRPQLLDVFFTKNATFDRRFTEFGGLRSEDGFEPTFETLAFVLGGGSLQARVAVASLLEPDHPFQARELVRPLPSDFDQPRLRAALRIAPQWLSRWTTGGIAVPAHEPGLPAHRIDTALEWHDLVLHPGTRKQLEEIRIFVDHGHTLLHDWGMAARLRPGYRALFHGAPGTGKTMSAALLGKLSGRAVYRVDLSMVVSKYVGETAKNLARVFDIAQRQRWILFFDEADALFGKRSEPRDAHDRYANQDVAYLLQRIETFEGITILASNLKHNIDEAFSRRFESIVYFPLPRPDERQRLWAQGFSPRAKLAKSVDLAAIAREHELAGGSIMNVIRQVSLNAIAEGERAISADDIAIAIRRELTKEGRGA